MKIVHLNLLEQKIINNALVLYRHKVAAALNADRDHWMKDSLERELTLSGVLLQYTENLVIVFDQDADDTVSRHVDASEKEVL